VSSSAICLKSGVQLLLTELSPSHDTTDRMVNHWFANVAKACSFFMGNGHESQAVYDLRRSGSKQARRPWIRKKVYIEAPFPIHELGVIV
jgi:hypothetical protein